MDDKNAEVANGVYFYKITAKKENEKGSETKEATGKLVKMK